MPLDEAAIGRGCPGARLVRGRQLCRAELERIKALDTAADVVIGCTQEAPLFEEVAEEAGLRGRIAFANLRETGGWSLDGPAAGPKMAALIAAAAVPMPETPLVALESQGVTLVLGRDEVAVEAARRLADRLDLTVLLLPGAEVTPPRTTDFPVLQGKIRSAKGRLGAFELIVDHFAEPAPSSRGTLVFGRARDRAESACDIVLDLTGGPALFPAAELRPGYLRADPRDPAAVARLLFEATRLVGGFDRPRYVTYRSELCAHSRSRRTGCTRCLEVCPTGAITPDGDHVAIDAFVCAGCGSCHAVCPTGAATYAVPPPDALLARLRALLTTYREAGGAKPVLLLHNGEHGAELIDALARFGDGLPANVLPLALNETGQLGLEAIAAGIAFGATGIRVLTRAKPRHDTLAQERTIGLATAILDGLGYGPGAIATIGTDDPDLLGAALREPVEAPGPVRPAEFLPLGDKRGLTRLALQELHRTAPAPVDTLALPQGAPFGTLEVNVEGCTLCLACVGACPTKALSDDPERPTLRFTETACVQCGLCAATCPEKVIRLVPRLDFRPQAREPRTIKAEEPFHCVVCDKPFGTRSAVERVIAKLEGRHWMFQGANATRLDALRMCDTCRVEAMTNQGIDPYAGASRPRPRTAEDYLRQGDEDLPDS